MDYKEKYEMALEGIQEILSSGEDSIKMSRLQLRLQGIFPELKESSDEQIRKRIIQALHGDILEIEEISKCTAWLEKQGESYTKKDVDDAYLKGVCDAKSELEKQQKPIKEHDVCDFCDEKHGCVSPCPTKLIEEEKPADNVEPKFKIGDTIIKKHNSDILYFGSFTITDITGSKYWYNDRIICDITEQDEWELYETVRQNTAKWSEEDNAMLISIENILIGRGHSFHDKEINWLKSLKDRVQPKQESDERNRLFGKLEEWLDEYVSDLADVDTATLIESFTNYLDGKLPKFLRTRNRWKPTKRQLLELSCAISGVSFDTPVLVELEEDLKKLMEE